MDEPKIKIGFTHTDEFGNEYSASSEGEVFESLGETKLDVIGTQFNVFLRQIGYIRRNDNILMEDLTEDELEALYDYLQELRNNNDESEENT